MHHLAATCQVVNYSFMSSLSFRKKKRSFGLKVGRRQKTCVVHTECISSFERNCGTASRREKKNWCYQTSSGRLNDHRERALAVFVRANEGLTLETSVF